MGLIIAGGNALGEYGELRAVFFFYVDLQDYLLCPNVLTSYFCKLYHSTNLRGISVESWH